MSAESIAEYQQRILHLEEALLKITNLVDWDSLVRSIALQALEEAE